MMFCALSLARRRRKKKKKKKKKKRMQATNNRRRYKMECWHLVRMERREEEREKRKSEMLRRKTELCRAISHQQKRHMLLGGRDGRTGEREERWDM